MSSRLRTICSGVLALLAALVPTAGAAQQSTPPGRLTVAVLWLADKTGDSQLSHWSGALTGLLGEQLAEAKAVRVLPDGAVDYAFRQLGVTKGSSLDVEQARRMGELIEARRVVWGSYRRQSGQLQVSAFVVNVAGAKVSGELVVTSADWFDVRDELAGRILAELGVKLSQNEQQKMTQQWRTSPAAFESYSRAIALRDDDRPFTEQEEGFRKALAIDTQFARAYCALAATLGSQGKFRETEQAARRALELDPNSASVHLVLGSVSFFLGKPAEAEQELQKANSLNPDDSEPLFRLGEFAAAQKNWDEAIAFLDRARALDPTDAAVCANLGLAYAFKRNRDQAMTLLREAERLSPTGVESANAEQMICQAYAMLGEMPQAVEHHERFVTLAKKMGGNPRLVSMFEERARQLKATLTPTFIEAAMPKIYDEQTLRETLQQKLTEDDLSMVVNPLAGNEQMKRWAEQLTEGADGDMAKARALFDGLTRRIETGDGRGHRTAEDVFAAWNDPNASLVCTEYANLFIALARAAGLKAFYVHLVKDYRGKPVPHDCVAVFADGKALLVDATYRWFAVPHKEFVILDDVQAIAHHLVQLKDSGRELARARVAMKLHPEFVWTQFALIRSLCNAGQWDEARRVFESVQKSEPDGCEVYLWRGIFADHEGDLEAAAGYLRKALELNPENALAHLGLGEISRRQGKLKEAREAFRICLRYAQDADTANSTRKMIAQINEQIGIEDSPSQQGEP